MTKHKAAAISGAGRRRSLRLAKIRAQDLKLGTASKIRHGSSTKLKVRKRASRRVHSASLRQSMARKKGKKTSGSGAASDLRRKELRLMSADYRCVVGADEAGRGPLCGPVVAGACFIPKDIDIKAAGLEDINDSKGLKKEDRERLYDCITKNSKIKWATGIVSAAEIDRINILQSSMRAMHEAVSSLPSSCKPDYVLIDGPRAPWGHERAVRPNGTVREADPPMPTSVKMCEPVIKGDSKVFCIAAASIIAKVTRDRIMDELDEAYPGYGLSQHAGYPTRDHIASIHRMGGVCPEHRMTFKPIRGSGFKVLPRFAKRMKSSSNVGRKRKSVSRAKKKG